MIRHELRFQSRDELSRAFERVSLRGGVEDCLVDPNGLTLLFRAPFEQVLSLRREVVAIRLARWGFELVEPLDLPATQPT